jgi:hypothetical protein
MWSLLAVALAQEAVAPPETRRAAVEPQADVPASGLSAFALFQARASANNLASTNPLLDGQIVGRLGGLNGVVVSPQQTAANTEQRANVFATYRPGLLGGRGGLTGAFEIDFSYGDAAYGTGGNTGGGFGADQVNLQTRRLHADWWPDLGARQSMHVVLGLQFVGDSANDPTATTPDGLFRSGGRTMFFGSEAAGLSVYGRVRGGWGDLLNYKLGTYTLVEQGASLPDDVWLSMVDVAAHPAYATTIGAHAWYIQDRSGGTGSGLGIGPTSDLYALQGGPSIDLYDGLPPPEGAPIDADLVWLAADAGYDAALQHGPVGVHAVAVLNVGKMYAPIVHDDDVVGILVDAEARVRWAQGEGSVARMEAVYSSGDDANPLRYSGVITGNAYGVAGALMPTHGALLLFPDARSINRMVGVVSDVSGAGRGLLGGSASLGFDPIPDRLNTKIGGALAWTADGQPWGTELNAGVSGEPLLFCNIGVYAATVAVGSASELDANPWTIYTQVDWLLF